MKQVAQWRRGSVVVAGLGLMSCADHKATALVVAFSADPGVVMVIKQIEISAARGSEPSFSQPYDVPSDIRFPATLTFSKVENALNSQSVLYKIVGMDATGKPRITRQARLGFVEEHTKLLRMPLEQSCLDHDPCKADETCAEGVCIKDMVDPGGLPDFTSNADVLSTGGSAGAAGAAGKGPMAGTGGAGGMGGAAGSGGNGGTAEAGGASGAAGTAGTAGTGGFAATAGTNGTGGTDGNVVVGCDTPSTSADGSISIGVNHGCAVMEDGSVRCWGEGATNLPSDIPYASNYEPVAVKVPIPTDTYKRVFVCDRTDCALNMAGQLRCWGSNYYGLLGISDLAATTSNSFPSGMSDVAVSTEHACATFGANGGALEGLVQCWGTNADGGIGVMPDSVAAGHSTPQTVPGVTSALQVSTDPNGGLTCARLSSGAVTCWGGDATHWEPAQALATGAVEIAIGGTTDARLYYRDNAGLVYELARDNSGVWGAPVQLSGLGAVANIHVNVTLCGVDANDAKTLRCTALPAANASTVVPRVFSSPIKDVSVGVDPTNFGVPYECVTLESGQAMCRGSDYSGMLGNGKPENIRLPLVVDLQGAEPMSLSTSYASTAIQTADGSIWVWGRNTAFFTGSTIRTPVQAGVAPLSETVKISMDVDGTLAYLVGNTVRKILVYGQEDSSSRLFSGSLTQPSDLTNVVAGNRIDIGVTASDVVAYATNVPDNVSHLLLDNSTDGTSHQTLLSGVSVRELAYRSDRYNSDNSGHACIRLDTGEVRCWGKNGSGETAQPFASSTTWPPATVMLDGSTPLSATSICAGHFHSCAVTGTGVVYCWGDNESGASEPNDLDAQDTATPTQVMTLDGAGPYHVSCGELSACAWTSAGMWCWGYNVDGQVGDPAVHYAISAAVTHVTHMPPAGYDSVLDVSVSELHTCALISGGGSKAVACWGGNVDGAVGVGPNGFFDDFQGVCGLDLQSSGRHPVTELSSRQPVTLLDGQNTAWTRACGVEQDAVDHERLDGFEERRGTRGGQDKKMSQVDPTLLRHGCHEIFERVVTRTQRCLQPISLAKHERRFWWNVAKKDARTIVALLR